jgi:hypothetical protein
MKALKTTLAAGIAAISLLAFQPAKASTLVAQHQHGAWSTSGYVGGPGEAAALCTAAVMGSDKMIAFKYQPGYANNGFFLHLWKLSWNVPPGTVVDVTMQVDSAPPMAFRMTAAHPPKTGGTVLEYDFDDTTPDPNNPGSTIGKSFIDLIATGLNVNFYFPDGTETPWIGRLNGSAAAIGDLAACAKGIEAATTSPSQPYGGQATTSPSQPYGGQPSGPTQPTGGRPTYRPI